MRLWLNTRLWRPSGRKSCGGSLIGYNACNCRFIPTNPPFVRKIEAFWTDLRQFLLRAGIFARGIVYKEIFVLDPIALYPPCVVDVQGGGFIGRDPGVVEERVVAVIGFEPKVPPAAVGMDGGVFVGGDVGKVFGARADLEIFFVVWREPDACDGVIAVVMDHERPRAVGCRGIVKGMGRIGCVCVRVRAVLARGAGEGDTQGDERDGAGALGSRGVARLSLRPALHSRGCVYSLGTG